MHVTDPAKARLVDPAGGLCFSNAGIRGAVPSIVDYPSDEFARALAVHILGAFHIVKHGAAQAISADDAAECRLERVWTAQRHLGVWLRVKPAPPRVAEAVRAGLGVEDRRERAAVGEQVKCGGARVVSDAALGPAFHFDEQPLCSDAGSEAKDEIRD